MTIDKIVFDKWTMVVTLKDIAKAVGVRESTVSRVLNNSPNPIRISEITREKILKIAKEWNYQPNAAARALSTQKTGHIGFILSDTVTDGWSNAYFAQQFAGVELAARERGYSLLVSMYNLSNIDTFVIPRKIGQRNVDGVVLTGFVQAAVVEQFKKFEIPCICINTNVEVEKIIATVGSELAKGKFEAIRYAAGLGHRRILFDAGVHPNTRREGERLIQMAKEGAETSSCEISLVDIPDNRSDYTLAKPLLDYWQKLSVATRPTVVMVSDHTAQELLREIHHRGLRCPEDVSVISNCDTTFSKFTTPALTAVRENGVELGRTAANILIDCLEHNIPLTPELSRNNFPCELVIRNSCLRLS